MTNEDYKILQTVLDEKGYKAKKVIGLLAKPIMTANELMEIIDAYLVKRLAIKISLNPDVMRSDCDHNFKDNQGYLTDHCRKCGTRIRFQ